MTTGFTVRCIHSSADRASAGALVASVASGPAAAIEVEVVLRKSRLVIMRDRLL